MAWLVVLILLAIGTTVFLRIGLVGVIFMMVAGGVGFAIGSQFETGWGIFGAILGGLIGIYTSWQNRRLS